MYNIKIKKLKLKESETLDSIIDRVEINVEILGESFSQSISLPEPDPNDFIPLTEITDEVIKSWVWDNLDLDNIDSMLLGREVDKASTAIKTTNPETSTSSYTVKEHIKQWKIDKSYVVDDLCYYEWEEEVNTTDPETGDPMTVTTDKKKFYRVIQAHTSQAGWTPKDTAALFTEIKYFGNEDVVGYPEWQQPQGAHDAYPIGSIVEHNGTIYEADVDANVWEPPTQWSEYTEPVTYPSWEGGISYTSADIVEYGGENYIALSNHTSVEGETPDIETSLWSVYTEGSSNAWAAGTSYVVDDVVTYNGTEYTCVQAHTSQVGWEPSNVPSLWSAV